MHYNLTKIRLDQLTSLRFFAAMMIVVHHAAPVFSIPTFGLNFGQGVSFFFVLSGFILAYVYPVLNSWGEIKRFYRARFARIWPVYIFCFILAFWIIPFSWEAGPAVASLLMVQAWFPMSAYYFSFNAASWSISTEVFFYIVFPILLKGFDKNWFFKLGGALVLLALIVFFSNHLLLPQYGDPYRGNDGLLVTEHGLIYINPLSRIFEFIVGMAVARVWKNNMASRFGGLANTLIEIFALVLCFISMCYTNQLASLIRGGYFGSGGGQYVVHSGSVFAFAFLIYVIAKGGGGISRVLRWSPFVLLGEISFSLYLLHQTILTIIGRQSGLINIQAPVSVCIFIALTVFLSYLVWAWIEVPARRVIIGDGEIHGTVFMKKLMMSSGLEVMKSIRSVAVLKLLSVVAFSYALYVALRYANQVPLDLYSFRQTQTALTAYWLAQDGFKLAYDTPVAGYPWSIPFEFPFYQIIVAVISTVFSLPLDATGRVVSFVFLALCLFPVRSITVSLRLPSSVFFIFVAIAFSAPTYLYWGRTFMIETAAVFFAVVGIKLFIDLNVGRYSLLRLCAFIACISISILQKATTGLPVLAVLFFAYLWTEFYRCQFDVWGVIRKRVVFIALCFAIPLLIGIAWTLYTDHVKSFNDLGAQLTSSALSKWNWGSPQQRFASELYTKVFWGRIFYENLAGALGMAMLLAGLLSKKATQYRPVVICSLVLGVLPLFLFSNLHIVHSYYQSANLIFFIFAVAVVLGGILERGLSARVVVVLLGVMMASNYYIFFENYSSVVTGDYGKNNSRDYVIGGVLKREIPKGSGFVAFGNDWSSSFSYISERKSFSVPEWFKEYDKVLSYPEKYLGDTQLGAIVLCQNSKSPTLNELISWSMRGRVWKIGETHGCYVATPEVQPEYVGEPIKLVCEGSLDHVEVIKGENKSHIVVAGWMATASAVEQEKIYVMLSGKGRETVYREVLRVYRPDVNSYLGISDQVDAGFSGILGGDLPQGEYTVGIARTRMNKLELCQFEKIASYR